MPSRLRNLKPSGSQPFTRERMRLLLESAASEFPQKLFANI
jgi:hypothetical protein